MLRFLIKFLLLAIILTASFMLIAQWKLKRDINAFANVISSFAEFNYESARIGLSGEVKLNSISIFIREMNANIEIGELRFFVGNLLDLAFFESDIKNHRTPQNARLILRDVLIPFNATLIEALKDNSTPNTFDILSAAYCGETDRIGVNEIEGMGYDYLSFSSQDFYMLDKYSGSAVINGSIQLEEFFDVEYQANIEGVIAWLESVAERQIGQVQQEAIRPVLSLLEFRIKDKGFNLNKAEYCAQKQQVQTDEYYSKHVELVDQLLTEADIKLKENSKQAYAEMIQPNSSIQWFIQPKVNFDFEGIQYYTFDELLEQSGLRIAVNNTPVNDFFEQWVPNNFNKIAIKELTKRAVQDPTRAQYKVITITKSYQTVLTNTAQQYIGFKVKVTRDDGKVYEGKLTRTSASSLWITIWAQKGELVVPFAKTRVVKMEVYKEDKLIN